MTGTGQMTGHRTATPAIFLTVLVILLGMLMGCITKSSMDPTKYIKPPSWTMEPTDTFKNTAPCSVFYCKNASVGILKTILTWATFGIYAPKPSLEEGVCWLEQVNPYTTEGQERLSKTLGGREDEYPRYFMIGSGPNLAAAEEARRYCGGSLGFAVQQLGGGADKTPKNISTESLREMLRADVIPFLTYHTPADGGKFTKELAVSLEGIGPVFVAPGAEFDFTTHNVIDPLGHFRLIKDNCKNCLTVAFVKFNDTATIEHYATAGGGVIQYIDVVGYGIDANTFDCDKNAIVLAISNFTETVSERWKKPSIVPYIRAEVSGNCTEERIARVYEALYTNIPFFVQQGLIGFGIDDTPRHFKENSILDTEGLAWFKGCGAYYDQRDPDLAQQVPLMFPEGGDVGGMSPCVAMNSMSVWLAQKCDLNYSAVSLVEPVDSSVLVGDVCLNENEFKTSVTPYVSVDKTTGEVLDGYEKYCEFWSQPIRQFASEFGFDQSVVRGIIWQENGFTQYAPIMVAEAQGEDESVCADCEAYKDNAMAYQICCGTARLKHYYRRASETLTALYLAHDSYGVCGGEPPWAKLYFAVYGYLYGNNMFEPKMNMHKICIENAGCYNEDADAYLCPFKFDDMKTKRLIAGAEEMRKVCKICTERKLTSEPEWAKTIPGGASAMPLENPICVLPFRTSMGTIWNSGIVLVDAAEIPDVFAISNGTVDSVKEGPRRGRMITIRSGPLPLWITYSSLSRIDVQSGQFVTTGQKIGEIDEQLRIEICDGSGVGGCANPALGVNRDFIDPASYLGISCPAID